MSKAAKAAGWTVTARVAAQACQLGVFLVAARYLDPESFGVFAMISAVVMLLQRLGEAGWVEFSTSAQAEDGREEAHAFTLAVVSGALATTVGCLGVVVLAFIASPAPQRDLLLLLSLSLSGSGAVAYWQGMLVRDGKARVLAQRVIASQVVGAGVTLAGFALGWGMVSLGAGRLATQVVDVAVGYLATRYAPAPVWRSDAGGRILEFTRSLSASRLLGYARGYSATLVLGLFLGPAAVGLYRAGARIAASLAEMLAEPARIVCWMVLRDATREGRGSELSAATTKQGERQALARSAEVFTTLLLLIATPLFVGLAVVSESAIEVVLGKQWLAAAPVLAFLALARLAMLPSVLSTPLLSMVGHVQRVPMLDLAAGASSLIALPLFAPFGTVWTAVGQFVAAIVGTGITARACAAVVPMRWGLAIQMSWPSLVASGAMVGAVHLLQAHTWGNHLEAPLRLGIQVLAGGAAFAGPFLLAGGLGRLREYAGRSGGAAPAQESPAAPVTRSSELT